MARSSMLSETMRQWLEQDLRVNVAEHLAADQPVECERSGRNHY